MPFDRASDAVASIVATGLGNHTDATDPHPQYARQIDGALRLPVFDADPTPPNAGALLYVFTTGSALQLRIIDSLGVVVTVGP